VLVSWSASDFLSFNFDINKIILDKEVCLGVQLSAKEMVLPYRLLFFYGGYPVKLKGTDIYA